LHEKRKWNIYAVGGQIMLRKFYFILCVFGKWLPSYRLKKSSLHLTAIVHGQLCVSHSCNAGVCCVTEEPPKKQPVKKAAQAKQAESSEDSDDDDDDDDDDGR